MNDSHWSFEILRQHGGDVWSWVCAAGATLLLAGLIQKYRLGTPPPPRLLILNLTGVIGTAAILALPILRSETVGLAWTFLLLTMVSIVAYEPLRDALGTRRVGLLLLLRILALAALVPMLFAPVVRLARSTTPQRHILFLVDTSGSMSFPDVQNGPIRLRTAVDALQRQMPVLRQQFLPEFFSFADGVKRLSSATDLSQQQADGKATDVVTAVTKALAAESIEDPAIVLVSDGIDNINADPAEALRAIGRPVYTLRVGSDAAEMAPLANIAVADVQADADFVVGHESQVTATIQSSALPDRVIDVHLAETDAAGAVVGMPTSKKLVLQPVPSGQTVTLPFTSAVAGLHHLAVWVDPVAGERSLSDNRQELQALAVDPTIRVLYVEGRLRPEYRELKRLLEHDPNVELATLLWVTPTKITAFGTSQRRPIAATLPQSLEQWKQFDVVILGDLSASKLSPDRLAQLERFVFTGGALLMLGGEESFAAGGYASTAIEKLLPVTLGNSTAPLETAPFVPRATDAGALHPALQGLAEWFGTPAAAPQRNLPPLNGNTIVAGEKSGAQTLLVHPDTVAADGRPQVILAVQRYGQGRSGALTAYSTYQWALPLYGLGQESPYNRLWGQLIRWLAGTEVRNRAAGPGLDVLLNKSVYPLGKTVPIRCLVRDSHGDATQYAQVTATIAQSGGTPPQSHSIAPIAAQPGTYEMVLPSPPRGDYTATVIATKDGVELGRQIVKFSVIPPADELLKIAANPDLMRRIADATHAKSYDLGQLPELIEELIRTDTRMEQSQIVTIRLANFVSVVCALFGQFPPIPDRFDLPLQALIVIPLLAAEWVLRRRWQLA